MNGVSGALLRHVAQRVGVGCGTVTEPVLILPHKVEVKTVRDQLLNYKDATQSHAVSIGFHKTFSNLTMS